jgi:hypothetical protein
MAWLTKSKFMSGLQCPKRLWFEVHQPLKDGLPESAAFLNGIAVDRMAQNRKPGTVVSRERGMPAAIAATSRLINAGAPTVMYQPAFRAGNLAVIADVLETGRHGVTLTEVKSSTSVKPEHVPDATYQTLVIRRARIPVDRVLLAHIDRGFELKRPGDYDGLLVEEDVTSAVEASLPEIDESATRLQEVMAARSRPGIRMGAQCTIPYECPFMDRCRAEQGAIPDYPVDLLPRGGETVEALQAAGYRDLKDVPADRLSGRVQQRVHQATVTGEVFFDVAATAELRGLTYPMSYLDFETIALAVPEIVGTRPYEPWPFQWSVHVEDSPGQVRHAEYLSTKSLGDLAALAAALLQAVPDSGPIFAYNAVFERGVLERLADRLPALAGDLNGLVERLVDLLPVTRAAYYHRDMLGSWSIKAVLPTIDPALAYERLGEVQEGDGASLAFMKLRDRKTPALRQRELTEALQRYCERDTWGMVVLRRFLSGAA